MSRSPEVEEAMQRVAALKKRCPNADGGGIVCLAAEVERLEKRLAHSHEVWRGEHDRAKAAEARVSWLEPRACQLEEKLEAAEALAERLEAELTIVYAAVATLNAVLSEAGKKDAP